MAWILVIWSLHIIITLTNLLSSFKVLKKPAVRKRRVEPTKPATTLTTTERARRKKIKEQLITWVVWIAYCTLERVSDRTLGWLLPFYDELKIITLLSILAWRSAGAELVFRKLFKPFISPYEAPLDAVGYVIEGGLGWVLVMLWSACQWAGEKWDRLRSGNGQTEEIPNIMLSLRSSNRPTRKLEKELADSIELSVGLLQNQQQSEIAEAETDQEEPLRTAKSIADEMKPRRPPPSATVAPTNHRPNLPQSTSATSSRASYQKPLSRSVNRPAAPIPLANSVHANHAARATTSYPTSEPTFHAFAATTSASTSASNSASTSAFTSTSTSSIYPSLPPSPFLAPSPPPAIPAPPPSYVARKRPATPSPPRSTIPTVSQTPAPPGFFRFSPAPALRDPFTETEDEVIKEVQESPRKKALSAIADLSRSLLDDESLSGGLGSSPGKRGREKEVGDTAARKKARVASKVKVKAKGKGKGKARRIVESDEDDEDVGSDVDEGEDEEDDDGTMTEMEEDKEYIPSPAKGRVTKSRSTTTIATTKKPSAGKQLQPAIKSASSRIKSGSSATTSRIPSSSSTTLLPRPRPRPTSSSATSTPQVVTSSRKILNSTSIPLSTNHSSAESILRTKRASSVVSTSPNLVASAADEPAPKKKKARRVLLGLQSRTAGLSDGEEDGVPVVAGRRKVGALGGNFKKRE